MNKYGATKGAQFSKEKAQLFGEVIERIEKQQGKVVPEIVVAEARQLSCPLHNYFEWDNTVAAEQYRLQQARHLLNHLTVVVNYETGEEQKAFFNVNQETVDNQLESVYVNIGRALSEKDLRKQVLANALSELLYWRDKYKKYSEFKGIVHTIDKFWKTFSKKK